jgi:HlyD family secretion protein
MHYFNCNTIIHTAALIGVFLLAGCGSEQKTVFPTEMDITEAVYASGVLLPEFEYKVFSPIDGIIVSSLVEENDTFRKGEILFKLETQSRRVQEQLLSGIYQTTLLRAGKDSPQYQDLEIKIQTAKSKIETDSLQFARLDALLSTGAIAKSDWDKAKLQLESTRNELRSLITQRENLLLQTRLESQQAENQFKTLQSQNQDGQVAGYMDGTIFEIYKKTGEKVSINEPLALAGNSDRWIARLTIDERDFQRVREGQEMIIKLDAFPEQSFSAVIHRILPKLNRAEQSFYAEAVFKEPLTKGIYGLNLEANILVRAQEKALTIPRQCLLAGDSVQVLRNGKVETIHVQTGIRNIDRVEIKAGLSVSDEVILN